ncbi:MAG: sugar transferase [Chloroflexi bacterium]|nr:sugar transferase [Chloroflexota bacterium]
MEDLLHQTNLYPVAARAEPLRLYGPMRRVADVVVAALLLILLAPMLFAIGLAVWLDSGLPIIYRCNRLGRFGVPITVLKFRTMRDGSHHHLQDLLGTDEMRALEYTVNRKLRADPRRTRVGTFLRRTSLDELPQLVNVLRGEMSLIGPRPYFPDELLDRAEAPEILSVRPGITGLWQVNGRSDRTFEERVGFDLDYVRGRGVFLDARIIASTVLAVFSGRGAY